MTTASFNAEQKRIRKELDRIAQEKEARSAAEKISPKAEHKAVDTGPSWEGDKRFNERGKSPL